jgi:hypothetical protein
MSNVLENSMSPMAHLVMAPACPYAAQLDAATIKLTQAYSKVHVRCLYDGHVCLMMIRRSRPHA